MSFDETTQSVFGSFNFHVSVITESYFASWILLLCLKYKVNIATLIGRKLLGLSLYQSVMFKRKILLIKKMCRD